MQKELKIAPSSLFPSRNPKMMIRKSKPNRMPPTRMPSLVRRNLVPREQPKTPRTSLFPSPNPKMMIRKPNLKKALIPTKKSKLLRIEEP